MQGTAQRILVVDDNPGTTRLLEEVLRAEGHAVTVAADGLEALAYVRQQPPDMVLLDLDLPFLCGYDVCRSMKQDPATRWVPIVIITAESASEAKLRSWELGADDFLAKPFQCIEVVARCRSLLRVKRLLDELDSAEAVVFAFARAVEAKSPFTHGHAERVREYALRLAGHLGIDDNDRNVLSKGALLHDIGKLGIPDVILNKPGPLTTEEFDLVKQHTVQGAHIVEPLRSIHTAMPLIRWHHERRDGRGYPDGLRGDAIPLLVRILAVADVYDALSSPRPYRPALPHAACLDILREDAAGGGLDPDIVSNFCRLLGGEPEGRNGPGEGVSRQNLARPSPGWEIPSRTGVSEVACPASGPPG
jgi:putative two-component system response regulator